MVQILFRTIKVSDIFKIRLFSQEGIELAYLRNYLG